MVKLSMVLAFLVLLSLDGCIEKNRISPHIEYYDLSDVETGNIEQIFYQVELCPLKFEAETYPDLCLRYEITDSLILITDSKQLIHVFEKDGHYLSCSKIKYGNGPGEYDILMGVFPGKDDDEINILTPFRLITYDKLFDFKGETTLPTKFGEHTLLYDRGYSLGDYKYILLPSPTSEQPEKIDIFDSKKREIIQSLYYPNEVVTLASLQNTCFTVMPDSALFFCPPAYTNSVYKVSGDSLIEVMCFSYGSEIISKEDILSSGKDFRSQNEFLKKSIQDRPVQRILNSKFIYELIRNEPLSTKEWYYFISNRESGTSIKIPLSNGVEFSFPTIGIIDETYAYAIYSKEFLLSNPTLLLDKKDSAEEDLKDIDMEDYVLLKYKFRR